MKFKVSVVVPVYNVEGYVEKCIQSILKQTYRDFELLLIDDGSTDKSGKICEEYSNKYKKIKTYHKKNGGLSDARNFGMKHAKGRYFAFIDADDYVDSCYLEVLYNLISDFKVKISCVNSLREFTFSKDTSVPIQLSRSLIKEEKISKVKAYHKMLIREDFSVSAWGKMYDKSLFENIEFPTGKLFEDLLTIPYIFEKCDSIAFSNLKCYHYVKRSDSIVNRRLTDKDLTIFEYLNQLKFFIEKNYSQLMEEFNCFYMTVVLNIILERMVLNSAKKGDLNLIINKNETIWRQALKNKYLNKKRKLEVVLMIRAPYLLRILLKRWNKNHQG